MAPSSFGLPADYKKIILEEIFLLIEYCKVSWADAWDMPVVYRHWFIERKQKENEKKKEAENKSRGKTTSPPPRKMGNTR